MKIIDAHAHVVGDHPDTVTFLENKDIKLLNICVAENNDTWRKKEGEPYKQLAQQHPERYAWCTSFDLPTFDDTDYVDKVIEQLEKDFQQGAVACKVWKNIGMEVRKPDGELLLVDDPLFEPLFEYLTRKEKPLLMHIAEPRACWRPISEESPHREYYKNHPEWHMHGRKTMPSHEELIAARDKVVEKHPQLKVIGAHLASLEHDVGEVAKRLDRYPNFAVDISARLGDLLYQDRRVVRDFFIQYQDRILFGTDIVMRQPHSALSEEKRKQLLDDMQRTYSTHFRYFETDEQVSHRGGTSRGIHLPDNLLAKFYAQNARSWFPGL